MLLMGWGDWGNSGSLRWGSWADFYFAFFFETQSVAPQILLDGKVCGQYCTLLEMVFLHTEIVSGA